MTSDRDTFLKTVADDTEVMLHRLASCHLEFQEDMVITAAYENTRLGHSKLLNEFEVLF